MSSTAWLSWETITNRYSVTSLDDHVHGPDVDQTVGDRDQLEVAEFDLGARLVVGLQAQLGADVLLGLGLVGDAQRTGGQRLLVDDVA